jgi:hypothetical protein
MNIDIKNPDWSEAVPGGTFFLVGTKALPMRVLDTATLSNYPRSAIEKNQLHFVDIALTTE